MLKSVRIVGGHPWAVVCVVGVVTPSQQAQLVDRVYDGQKHSKWHEVSCRIRGGTCINPLATATCIDHLEPQTTANPNNHLNHRQQPMQVITCSLP